jgi:hypothetical protein
MRPHHSTLAELRKDVVAAVLMLAVIGIGAMLWSLLLS